VWFLFTLQLAAAVCHVFVEITNDMTRCDSGGGKLITYASVYIHIRKMSCMCDAMVDLQKHECSELKITRHQIRNLLQRQLDNSLYSSTSRQR
jgi:hypothetical protein